VDIPELLPLCESADRFGSIFVSVAEIVVVEKKSVKHYLACAFQRRIYNA